MKSIILFTALILLMVHCKEEIIDLQTSEVIIAEGDQKIISSNLDLSLAVLEINESRCPSDVVCVRLGEAIVKIELSNNQESFLLENLCIGDCNTGTAGQLADSTLITLDQQLYVLKLKDVNPYPSTENNEAERSAIFDLKALE